jgi:ATP-dependent helicase/nuclease subunit B
MEVSGTTETDAWLRQGGIVVTASERAARALTSTFNRARMSEGLKTWPAPTIQDWNSFVRNAWAARTTDACLLLNSTQEQAIWARLAAADGRLATLLEGPRYRLANLAMEAHELLCAYAPRFLRHPTRSAWQNDAAAFSSWLAGFEDVCRSENLLSPARLPIELLHLLQNPPPTPSQPQRPPLLLAGFDRILPVQRAVFDAWGRWQQAASAQIARNVQFHEAPDDKAELAACALWCKAQFAANPDARILVITRNATENRGQIERAFLGLTVPGAPPVFEFSLGIPLAQVALPRSALLLLRWLSGPLAEHELDWLLSTAHAAATPEESSQLQSRMRALRRAGLEQPSWTLQAFLAPNPAQPSLVPPPAAWAERMTRVSQRLKDFARRPQTPLDWAELVPQLLEEAAWPGAQQLSSAGFQSIQRWQQALETAASLAFDGRRIAWKDFLSILARTLEETLFAAESRDAPMQIAGPAESAGLTADAIWFLGATEDSWPSRGATHPLIPPEVQRESQMPHATPQLDWDLAQAITTRLADSAPQVHFSYARQTGGAESRPSRLLSLLAGQPLPLPTELLAAPAPSPLTVTFEDFSQIPYPPGNLSNGAGVLTAQSQCPFKAFATARLGAQTWGPAQAGLTPSQRGNLLHDVLHAVWAGPTRGIRNFDDLQKISDRLAWVAAHVARVFESELPNSLRDRMPARYLELEQHRLTRLVTQWLDYESTRIAFEVLDTEARRQIQIEGLSFNVRLDRLDRLSDGSVLVIDYKSGDVNCKAWNLPRPDDVQLPLYARFALNEDEPLGGLTFAKIRPGQFEFAGSVGAPAVTLFAGLKNTSSLAKNLMSLEQLLGWRDYIEQLARDFLAGRADVDPRDPPSTCKRCGLQTLCRIHETKLAFEDDGEGPDGPGFNEAADE